MRIFENSKTVTVFGGSGFVGRHVVRALAKRGYRVVVAVRRPDLAVHLQPLGNMGQIRAVQANLRYRASVDSAVEGADAVVNLVGILKESGRQKFDAVQAFGARAVAEAARARGARLVHVSAIGANPDSPSLYARTKAEAEAAVLSTVKDAVIFRPSIVFGPEDDFFNRFGSMATISPFLPLIGGGKTRFQPVFVGDVAEAVALAVDGMVAGGKVYELGGPEVVTFRECMEIVRRETDRSPLLVSIPWFIAKAMARLTGWLPGAPVTHDQVLLLQSDNVVSEAAAKSGRTLAGLGIKPHTLAAIVPAYLARFRPQGQFQRRGEA
ncbi:MAG TPA: complex I NDUFA9 subunit family protein [Rhizobiaceae bacterium]|nr:complex I NDUFA9 subunit family protein [Rhizobiaceae bacterium]